MYGGDKRKAHRTRKMNGICNYRYWREGRGNLQNVPETWDVRSFQYSIGVTLVEMPNIGRIESEETTSNR